MKKLNYILIAFSVLITACYEDIGNYDYSDKEKISTEGIASSYTVVSLVDELDITPTLTSSIDENAEFECFWAIHNGKSGAVLDTISYTKDLHYEVTEDAGTWYLVFSAKNVNTGYSLYTQKTLNIITEFTRGWYALKDDGTDSDIDQYLTPDTIVPTQLIPDVYSRVNGSKISGEAKMISYLTSYKTYVASSSPANTKTLVAVTDNDMTFNYINTMEMMRDFTTFSYYVPEERNPGYVGASTGQLSLLAINAGKLHSIYTMMTNSGVFGYEATRNTAGDDYSLSDYALTGSSYFLFYDNMSGSFLNYSSYTVQFVNASKHANSDMEVLNTGKEMLYMGARNIAASSGVAYMKDKDEVEGADRTLVTLTVASKLTAKGVAISSDQKLYDGKLITCSQDEQVIYFVCDGKEIWSRNLASGLEQLQFTAGDDEEITMVRQKKYTAEAKYTCNYIIVATSNSANEYKARFFQKVAGNLNAEPDFVMEGEGRVKDITYISPSVGEKTYVYGY